MTNKNGKPKYKVLHRQKSIQESDLLFIYIQYGDKKIQLTFANGVQI